MKPNIKQLLKYSEEHPEEYNKLLYSNDKIRAFLELTNTPNLVNIRSEQDLILLIIETELRKRNINV